MKRLISLILCMVLLSSMSISAHAGVLDKLKQQYSTDSVSSASKNSGGTVCEPEHVSLGIKIPALDYFCGRDLDICFYDVLKNYVHICYEGNVSEDELDEYMELLEDEFDFQLAIYDWTRGIYGYDYYEEDIWTLYPGYGYKDEDDVALLIVHSDENTHMYYSIDFDYCAVDEKESSSGSLLENFEKFKQEALGENSDKEELELPNMQDYYGRQFEFSSADILKDYSHVCYETEYDFDDIESYVELLEDEYGFKRIYPEDYELNEGEYCLEYTGKTKVKGFRPEYYCLDMDVDVFIACYTKDTHIYFSNDFSYEYMAK